MNNFSFGVSESLILAQFFETMRQSGIQPHGELYPILDGNIHRFTIEGEALSHKSGAYYIHADEWPTWGFMDYHKHSSFIKFKFDVSMLGAYDLQEFKAQFKDTTQRNNSQAQKAENLKHQREKQQEAITKAFQEYEHAEGLTGTHEYLKAKNARNSHLFWFSCNHLVRTKKRKVEGDYCKIGDLLLPIINTTTKEFQSLQRIYSVGNTFQKGIYKGTSYLGGCIELVPYACENFERMFIAEGFATALAVSEIFEYQYPVFAAVSCNNIINVARALRTMYKNSQIIIAADNDTSGAGQKAAMQTIQAGYADKTIMPDIQGMDWNDYINSERRY